MFTLIYVILRQRYSLQFAIKLPSMSGILLFAIAVGLVSFLVRLVFPIGWVVPALGFQLAYFPQYIVLFAVGLLAHQNKWFDQLTIQRGKQFGWLALVLVGIGFPLLFVVTTKLQLPLANFNGGWNGQALVLCLWEQLTGLSISMALLSYGKYRWDAKNALLDKLVRSAYGTYVLHPLVIIGLSLSLAEAPLDPLLKLAFVAPLAVIGSFLIGRLALKIPGVDTIL